MAGDSPRAGEFAALVARLREGDRAALARAITRLESGEEEAAVAAAGLGWPSAARVVALTGPPGVGKSALAGALAGVFAGAFSGAFSGQGAAGGTGVLAVDPTSPRSGGALLGDRVRLTPRPGVFFRSMAARTGAGGLAPEVPGALRLMAAAGMTRLLLETAGVGQGDTAVTRLADLTLALTAPGLGDEVQAAKAGLFEVADFVIVNQCDRAGAEALASHFRALRTASPGGTGTGAGGAAAESVRLTSATEGDGVAELAEAVEAALAARPGRARAGSEAGAGSEAEGAPFPALRLHHVGLAARDADRAAALWSGLLGLRETGRYRVDEFGVLAAFLAPAGDAGAEDPGGLVELVQPTGERGAVAKFLERRGPGLHHVCFEVADLAAALRALADRGVRLVDEKPRRGAGGHLVAFVHPESAGGVLLELKQAERRVRPRD